MARRFANNSFSTSGNSATSSFSLIILFDTFFMALLKKLKSLLPRRCQLRVEAEEVDSPFSLLRRNVQRSTNARAACLCAVSAFMGKLYQIGADGKSGKTPSTRRTKFRTRKTPTTDAEDVRLRCGRKTSELQNSTQRKQQPSTRHIMQHGATGTSRPTARHNTVRRIVRQEKNGEPPKIRPQ